MSEYSKTGLSLLILRVWYFERHQEFLLIPLYFILPEILLFSFENFNVPVWQKKNATGSI